MSEIQNDIINRVVVTGLDDVVRLKRELTEITKAHEIARRSDTQQTMFKGDIMSVEALKKRITELTTAIAQLNSEVNSVSFNGRERALNEELKVRKAISKEQQRQIDADTKEQQRLDSRVSKLQQQAQRQIDTERNRQITGNPTLERQQLSRANSVTHAQKQSDLNAVFGVLPSYAQQMNSLNKSFEEQFQRFRAGSIGAQEYANNLAQYKAQVSDLKVKQQEFNDVIGKSQGAFGAFSDRVRSHFTWIVAGGLIASLTAIPLAIQDTITQVDSLTAKIKQNLELAERYHGNMTELDGDMKHLQDVAAVFATGYGVSLHDTMEMMQVLSRRFKSPEEITYYTNLAMTMSKLDFVAPKKAAEDLEATILSMGLNFEQSKRFIDEFSVAVHVARITGTELLTGLQRSAATFHNMNFNTAEAIAMISTLSTVTAKAGANVGAALNSILVNIDFKKAAQALKAYSVEVYDSSGNMREGVEIWRDIARIFNGLDDQKANEFANAMSGGERKLAA